MLRKVKFRGFNRRADSDEDTDPSLLRKNVILKEEQDIKEEYSIGEYLGSGKFGEVKKCTERSNGYEFAAKFIPAAAKEDWDSARNEIAIMNRLRHPRLIQLYDAYSWNSEVILVLELITGGELFERIIDESFDLNESRCIRFTNEILQGVQFIHSQNVLHLDLKPENILCLSNTSFKTKIIDFGLARFYDNQDMRVLFGTPEFVSPEVISYDPVSPAADMWSVGVICYVMLSGLSPFMGDTPGETMSNILRVTYNFNYPEFSEISEEAMAFIRALLIKDPRKRMTASECLQHPWIKKKRQLKRKGTVSKKRLKHFVYRRKWQKAVNAIIALLRMGVVLRPDPTYSSVESPTSSTSQTSPADLVTTYNQKGSYKILEGSAMDNRPDENLSRKTKPPIEPKSSANKTNANQGNNELTNNKANKGRRPSFFSRFTRTGSNDSSRRDSKVSVSDDGKTDNKIGKRKKKEETKTKVKQQEILFNETRKSDKQKKIIQLPQVVSKRKNSLDIPKKKTNSPVTSELPPSTPTKIQGKSAQFFQTSPSSPTSKDAKHQVAIQDNRFATPKIVKVKNKSLPVTTGISARIGFFSNLGKEDQTKSKR